MNGVLTEQDGDEDGQGVGSGLADIAVMQNPGERPNGMVKMVKESLGLICKPMLPLPRGGVFDPRGYTEASVG